MWPFKGRRDEIDPAEVQRIMTSLERARNAPVPELARGDRIRVVEGPFSDFTGKIEDVDADREKFKVLINIFGRDTPTELDFNQVKKL